MYIILILDFNFDSSTDILHLLSRPPEAYEWKKERRKKGQMTRYTAALLCLSNFQIVQ
jgi:hypothetical protein